MRRDGSSLRDVFVHPRERRLRAGWRLLAATGLLVATLAASVAVVETLLATETGPEPPVRTLAFVFPTVALLFAARVLDRRTLAGLGLSIDREWGTDLLAGFALGTALPALVFLAEYAVGFLRVTAVVGLPGTGGRGSVTATLALAFLSFACVGVFEELLFRGYLLTNVAEGLAGLGPVGPERAVVAAAAATSLLFGVAHGFNPNATPLAVVLVTLYGGLLASGYLLTGRLALPVGFHVAWNVAVSAVFGFPVSGFPADSSVVGVEQSGPAIVTGGPFGPEGGLISLPALATGTVLVLAWIRQREGSLRIHPRLLRPPTHPDRGDE